MMTLRGCSEKSLEQDLGMSFEQGVGLYLMVFDYSLGLTNCSR